MQFASNTENSYGFTQAPLPSPEILLALDNKANDIKRTVKRCMDSSCPSAVAVDDAVLNQIKESSDKIEADIKEELKDLLGKRSGSTGAVADTGDMEKTDLAKAMEDLQKSKDDLEEMLAKAMEDLQKSKDDLEEMKTKLVDTQYELILQKENFDFLDSNQQKAIDDISKQKRLRQEVQKELKKTQNELSETRNTLQDRESKLRGLVGKLLKGEIDFVFKTDGSIPLNSKVSTGLGLGLALEDSHAAKMKEVARYKQFKSMSEADQQNIITRKINGELIYMDGS